MTGRGVFASALRRGGAVSCLLIAPACADEGVARRLAAPRPVSDAGVGAGGGAASAPCEEGDRRACHVTIGEHEGVLDCFVGVAVCHDGAFGACVDGDVESASAQGYAALAANTSDECASNPCDPYCHTVSEAPDGGLVPATVPGGTWLGGSLAAVPGGFANKGLKDRNHPPGYAPCTAPSDCQFDTRCVDGACVAWAPGEVDSTCAGMDLTAGVPCGGVVPVCNRGTVTAPAGQPLLLFAGNSAQLQDDLGRCTRFTGVVVGACLTPSPIAPGHCVDVPGCPLDGTRAVYVNPWGTIGAPDTPAECHCGNGWTVSPADTTCYPIGEPMAEATYVERLVADCPAGTRVQWGWLSWEAAVPSDASGGSSVTMRARTGGADEVLATTPGEAVVLASVPATAPASCPLGGPVPCPVDVFAALDGLPRAGEAALELSITLTPAPDGLVGPSLAAWRVTYSCPPSE